MSALQVIALVGVCLAAALFVAAVLHRLAKLDRQCAKLAFANGWMQSKLEASAEVMGQQGARIEALEAELKRQTEAVAVTGSGRPQLWEQCPRCSVRGETRDAIRHHLTCPYYVEERTRSIPAPPKASTRKA